MKNLLLKNISTEMGTIILLSVAYIAVSVIALDAVYTVNYLSAIL
jgi:hypothetical protein